MSMTEAEMIKRIEDGDAVAVAFELRTANRRLNEEAEHLNKLVINLRETRQQDAAKIAKLQQALEAGPARLREMAADYDPMGLSALQITYQRSQAAIIRSADLINAALHVEAAQKKVLES